MAATVQQQSHSKYVGDTINTYHTCVDIANECTVCAMGMCAGVRVCGCIYVLARWHPTFQPSFTLCLLCVLLAAAAAVSCRSYHTAPQALELPILWQPRYNSSPTARWCGPLLFVC